MPKPKVKRYEGTISEDLFNDIQVLQLQHIDEDVSVANPIPWTKWLPLNCGLAQTPKGTIQHFNAVNCHYILYKNYVFHAFGYHGYNVFNDLVSKKDKTVKQWADYKRNIDKVFGK